MDKPSILEPWKAKEAKKWWWQDDDNCSLLPSSGFLSLLF